jgi:MerR family mercuric resistance operon transcriptional regulator
MEASLRLTIGGVAQDAGVTVETIRFYERLGLLSKPTKPHRGHREYPPETIGRVGFIKRAQELGFSLREIHELIALQASTMTGCDKAYRAAEAKIREIDAKVEDLLRIRVELDNLVRSCRDRASERCAILESLQSG